MSNNSLHYLSKWAKTALLCVHRHVKIKIASFDSQYNGYILYYYTNMSPARPAEDHNVMVKNMSKLNKHTHTHTPEQNYEIFMYLYVSDASLAIKRFILKI